MGLPGLDITLSHLRELSPGDKCIAGALFIALCVLILSGLYTLERTFLVAVPSYGGELVEGIVGAPRFVNPLFAVSDADRDLTLLTYAGLMGYDSEGALVPVLAESYEQSEDGTTYTFRLRGDAVFSDGSPVTAEDVVFTVRKAQDPALKSPRLSDFLNIAVETRDARTVVFTLPEAYAPFIHQATLGILPARLWGNLSNEEFLFSSLMQEPVGAGPFKVARIQRDKNGSIERYTLTRFDRYALTRPYLSQITFVYFKDTESLAEALERGRVESAYGVPHENALRVPYSRVFGVFFNQSKNPVLAKLPVREALSIAVNRTELITEAIGGYGVPVYGPVPPDLLLEESQEDPDTRIEDATHILRDAGWEYDEEKKLWVHEKDALSLSFTLTTAHIPELKAVAEALRDDWGTLGVPVTIEFYDQSELLARSIRPREYEALLFGMVIDKGEDLFAFWDSSQRQDPGLNVSLYTSLSVDELLEELRGNTSKESKQEALATLDALIRKDVPAVFTHAPEFIYTVPKNLEGVRLGRISTPSERLVGVAFWYRHKEYVWPVFHR